MKKSVFRLRAFGRDHVWHDLCCPGCEKVNGRAYPRPHKDFGTGCLGFVHAELLKNGTDEARTVLVCDVCFGNPK